MTRNGQMEELPWGIGKPTVPQSFNHPVVRVRLPIRKQKQNQRLCQEQTSIGDNSTLLEGAEIVDKMTLSAPRQKQSHHGGWIVGSSNICCCAVCLMEHNRGPLM